MLPLPSETNGEIEKEMNCIECDCELKLAPDTTVGEILTCPDCGSEFEITQDGIKVAESIGEDWGE